MLQECYGFGNGSGRHLKEPAQTDLPAREKNRLHTGHCLVDGEEVSPNERVMYDEKGTRQLISALWARSNAALNQNQFPKISPGEF